MDLDYYSAQHSKLSETRGKEHISTINNLHETAKYLTKAGNHEIALNYYQDTLDLLLKRRENDGDEKLVTVKSHIGMTYYYLEEYNRTLDYLNEVLSSRMSLLGVGHRKCIITKEYIASSHRYLAQYGEALEHYKELYNIKKSTYGEHHLKTINTKFWVARVSMQLGYYEVALEHFESVYPIFCELLGSDHEETLIVRKYLEGVQQQLNKSSICNIL